MVKNNGLRWRFSHQNQSIDVNHENSWEHGEQKIKRGAPEIDFCLVFLGDISGNCGRYGRVNKSGWWYTYPSEKMMEFVSWGYYSQLNGKS